MDSTSLKIQAERCRRLARGADPFTQERLLALAAEYDKRILAAEQAELAAWDSPDFSN